MVDGAQLTLHMKKSLTDLYESIEINENLTTPDLQLSEFLPEIYSFMILIICLKPGKCQPDDAYYPPPYLPMESFIGLYYYE